MLKMTDVSKVYRTDLLETHALNEFSLTVDEGEFVTITGPSGCGKTTFLNIAGLLEAHSSGEYFSIALSSAIDRSPSYRPEFFVLKVVS